MTPMEIFNMREMQMNDAEHSTFFFPISRGY